MSGAVKLRVGTAADLRRLLELERAVEAAPHWSEAVWSDALASRERERVVLVAEREALLVGFAVGLVVAGVAEVESIAVDERVRRAGLGRQMLEWLCGWARGRGAQVVELEVRESNRAARAFYARAGFCEQGRRRKYYAGPVEDAVLLEMRL